MSRNIKSPYKVKWVNMWCLHAKKKHIYRDGDKVDWQTNPYDMIIETKTVTANETLKIRLAAAGGVAIRFKISHNH
jgi:Holliday junction resolvasome RuvABC endonuclease subunit